MKRFASWRGVLLLLPAAAAVSACDNRAVVYEVETSIDAQGTWVRTFTARGYGAEPLRPSGASFQLLSTAQCAVAPECPPEDEACPGEEAAYGAMPAERAAELRAQCRERQSQPPPKPKPPRASPCGAEELAPFAAVVAPPKCGDLLLSRASYRSQGERGRQPEPEIALNRSVHGRERHAGNAPIVRFADVGVLRVWEYRERFTQFATAADFMDVGRAYLDAVERFLLGVLERELAEDYDTTQAQAYVHQLRREAGEVIAVLAESNKDLKRAKAELRRRLQSRGLPLGPDLEMSEAEVMAWFDKSLSPLFVPRRPDVPPLTARLVFDDAFIRHLSGRYGKAVGELFNAVLQSAGLIARCGDEPCSPEMQSILAKWEEIATAFKDRTRFRVRLQAPGRVVATNGAIGADNAIEWSLTPSDFDLAPREIHATSVELRPELARLYPQAKLTGEVLRTLAAALGDLTPEEQTRLGAALAKKDVAPVAADVCKHESLVPALSDALGLAVACPET